MSATSKTIHVVGGGANQVPLVLTAKRMGLQVLVTDMYPDPPCRQFADDFEQIDTTDLQASLACASKHKIDYVTTDQTDVAVPTVAYIAEKLGLPGIGYNTALRFTNKYVMRRALKGKLDDCVPESHYFHDESKAFEFCEDLPNPSGFIVKPINSQGSKGVAILGPHHRQLIATAFKESLGRGIIVERFVSGFEFSVESFVHAGRVHNLTLTKKYHFDHNPCLDERNTFLGDVGEELERKIFELNTKVIKALGLSLGNTHAEFKVEDGRPYLIEIAARGAGGSISSKIIPYLTGFDPLTAMMNQLQGDSVDMDFDDYKTKYAILKFFNFRPGIVKAVHINEKLVSDLMVFQLDLEPDDRIVLARDSRDRKGYFIVHGDNREHVLKQEKEIEASTRVEYRS